MLPDGAGSAGGSPRAAGPWEVVLYLSGLAVVVVTLLSPLDTCAAWLFTLHMVEYWS